MTDGAENTDCFFTDKQCYGKLSKQLKECGQMLTKGAFLQILAAPLAPPGP